MLQQQLNADEVGDQEVDRQVQASASIGERHLHLEQRPSAGCIDRVGHLLAGSADRGCRQARACTARVGHTDGVLQRVWQHTLGTIVVHDRTQHVVP